MPKFMVTRERPEIEYTYIVAKDEAAALDKAGALHDTDWHSSAIIGEWDDFQIEDAD